MKMGYDYIGIESDREMYDKAVPYLAQLDRQYTNIRRLEDWV